MWKFTTLAVLAMAGATQGAVTLTFEVPVNGFDWFDPRGQSQFTFNVMLNVGPNDLCTGVTFATETDKPGALRLVGREITNPVLTDPTTANGTLFNPLYSLLNPKNAKDIGLGSSDGVTPTAAGKQLLMKLTFAVEPGVTWDMWTHLFVVGVCNATQGVWADPDFNTHPLPITTFGLVPEPGSLVLLVCGVGMLGRRRQRIVR